MITINGITYSGKSISIINGKIRIDGSNIEVNDKVINISVSGNIQDLSVDACEKVTVNGQVVSLKTMSGDVECGDVTGSISTMSGDVRCGNIGGNVSTMSGDVK